MSKQIEVPRENVNNKGVCDVIEKFLLDIFNKDIEGAYHTKDLKLLASRKYGAKYGNLEYHVVRALDQFFANRLIKRVAPSVFQSVNGPDDEFSERASGHVPEGQPYEKRPGNYTNNQTVPSARSRADFNREVRKTEASIKILQRCNVSVDIMQAKMIEAGFNPVAVKHCLKQLELAA